MHKLKTIIKSPVTYATCVDILFLLLIIASGFVLSEIILPGIISAYISPFVLFSIIFITLITIIFLAHKQDISFSTHKTPKKRIMLVYTIIFIGCIGVAGFRFGWIPGAIMTFLSTLAFMLFFKVIHESLAA